MAITRMNMLKNKMGQGVKLQKKQIADLLQNQKDESARIKVENIIRDDYMMESFEILEILCELLSARVLLISESKFVVTLFFVVAISLISFLQNLSQRFERSCSYCNLCCLAYGYQRIPRS